MKEMEQIKIVHNNEIFLVMVDREDIEKLSKFRWRINITQGYIYTYMYKDGKRYLVYLHRYLMGLESGNSLEVDHVNHNKLDNRKANLRVCTHQQNLMNKSKYKRKEKDLPTGVYYNDNTKKHKYKALIRNDGKLKFLGNFETPEEAHEKYLEHKRKNCKEWFIEEEKEKD